MRQLDSCSVISSSWRGFAIKCSMICPIVLFLHIPIIWDWVLALALDYISVDFLKYSISNHPLMLCSTGSVHSSLFGHRIASLDVIGRIHFWNYTPITASIAEIFIQFCSSHCHWSVQLFHWHVIHVVCALAFPLLLQMSHDDNSNALCNIECKNAAVGSKFLCDIFSLFSTFYHLWFFWFQVLDESDSC